MSVNEIIALARAIVNGQPVKTPQIEAWELDEIMWWAKNISSGEVFL